MVPAAAASGTNYLAQAICWTPSTISGVAVGDFDGSRPRNEVVVVSGTDATEVYYDRGNWPSRLLFRDATLLLGVAVGDFDSSNPGEEIVTVGQSGKVAEIYGSHPNWKQRFLYKDPMDLEHVAVGDVDGDGHSEIVVGGSSGNLTIISERWPNWVSRIVFTEQTGIAGIAVGDFDNNHPGNEIAVIGQRDGRVYEVYNSGSTWSSKLVWTDVKATPSSGLTCVAVGEFNTSFLGSGIVVGGKLGQVIGIQGSGLDWTASTLYWFDGPVARVEVGDFDASHYGEEIVVAEYDSHRVFQLHNLGHGWTTQLMFTYLDAPMVIAIGDFYDDSKNALIIAGYSGTAIMLRERGAPLPEPISEFWCNVTFGSAPGVSSITIDNTTYTPDQLPKMFKWMRGSHHSFNCSKMIVSNTTTTRHIFVSWNDEIRLTSRELAVSENMTFVACYRTQYYLTVSSPLGNPEGEGWYDAGFKAFVSTQESVPTDDLYGRLGARHLFESWRGGLYTQQPRALVLMHEPKSMWAVYSLDYKLLATTLAMTIAISASVLTLLLLQLKRMRLLKTPSAIRHVTALKQGIAVLLILVAIYKTLSTIETPFWIAVSLSAFPGLAWVGYRLLYARHSKRSPDR